jgi:hypothetical protein
MWLGVGVFGEYVIFFHQPINLKPVVQAVFVAGIVRVRVWLFLLVGDDFQNCGHTASRVRLFQICEVKEGKHS